MIKTLKTFDLKPFISLGVMGNWYAKRNGKGWEFSSEETGKTDTEIMDNIDNDDYINDVAYFNQVTANSLKWSTRDMDQFPNAKKLIMLIQDFIRRQPDPLEMNPDPFEMNPNEEWKPPTEKFKEVSEGFDNHIKNIYRKKALKKMIML